MLCLFTLYIVAGTLASRFAAAEGELTRCRDCLLEMSALLESKVKEKEVLQRALWQVCVQFDNVICGIGIYAGLLCRMCSVDHLDGAK